MKTRPCNTKAFDEALRACPKAGSGVHGWIMRCADLAALAGIPEQEAGNAIAARMPRAASPASEVACALQKAYSEVRQAQEGGRGYVPTPTPKAKPAPLTAKAFIQRGTKTGADEADWFERSPYRLDMGEPSSRDMLPVLATLYAPDDVLFLGGPYDKTTSTAAEWTKRIQCGIALPPHFCPNPLKPKGGRTKDGKPSMRCDDAVQDFRFAVAEFDEMPRAEQLAFWAGFESAPIAALVDSGGKSIHAWLAVYVASREQWKDEVENLLFAKVLCPLGCDRACKNPSRLSRTPGHFREEKGHWQKLLYLNPHAGK